MLDNWNWHNILNPLYSNKINKKIEMILNIKIEHT